MPRAGLTYDDVTRAAEELVTLGSPSPTVKQLRERLGGTGSNSTIGEHLRTWRASKQPVPPPVLELSPNVMAAIAKDLQGRIDQVRAPIEEREKTALLHQAEAEKSLDRVEGDLQTALDTITKLETQVAEARGRTEEVRDKLTAIESKLAAAEQRAAAADKGVAVAEAKLAAAEQRVGEALARERQAHDELRTAKK